jgi:hypothetical protein
MTTPPKLTADFEITVVGGERGRQLAAAQAESIQEILEWFGRLAGPSDRSSPEQAAAHRQPWHVAADPLGRRDHAPQVRPSRTRRPDRPDQGDLAGDRPCPPEDCGGTPGYEDLIAVLTDPDRPEHEGMLRWLGIDDARDFDPARFDLDDANRRLDTAVRTPARAA